MKVEELRIGNYVFDNLGGILKIKGVSIDSDLSHIKTIPLTEEWLLKMGFDIVYSSNFRLKFDHQEHTRCGFDFSHTADKSMEGFRFYGHYIGIKYVHDLQNIFYSLTGEELTIKE